MFTPHQVSRVRCHVSRFTWHLSCIFIFFFWQSGGASWWRVCFQQGLPHLVFIIAWKFYNLVQKVVRPLSLRVLSLLMKTSYKKSKIMIPSPHSWFYFRIALTLDEKKKKNHYMTACVQKWHINAIFGYTPFQKLNFDFYWLRSCFVQRKLKAYLTLCLHCWLRHL